jgi:K+ transporter
MPGGAVLNPDSAIPRQLSVCGGHNKVQRVEAIEAALPVDLSELLLLSRHLLKPAAHSGMPRWQDLPFVGLSRSANDATDYFQIPTGRVVEADHDLGA